MAAHGTFFEPQTGLLLQNYLENKSRFLGEGNFDEAGFKFMEEGIALNDSMFKMAIRHKTLKINMGTGEHTLTLLVKDGYWPAWGR